MDLYKKIAEEENVSRQDVKTAAFPFLYGMGPMGEPVEFTIRNAVRIGIELGWIKRLEDPYDHGNGD